MKDISYLLKYIKIPSLEGNYILRGKFLYLYQFYIKTTCRSKKFYCGISNLKKIDKDKLKTNLVDLICFEVIEPELKPRNNLFSRKGFKVVYNEIQPKLHLKALAFWKRENRVWIWYWWYYIPSKFIPVETRIPTCRI